MRCRDCLEAIYEKDGDWYSVYDPERPWCSVRSHSSPWGDPSREYEVSWAERIEVCGHRQG